MDDYLEIDLRKIIKNILSKWYWVVIPAAVIGIAVFLYSFLLMPDVYKANATIIITNPRYVPNFGYETENPTKPSASAIMSLAKCDAILLQLFDLWETEDKEQKANIDLSELLTIDASDGDMLYTLSVEEENAQEAAKLANAWADLVVDKVNSDFFNNDEGLVEQFNSNLVVEKDKMERANTALVDFTENDPRNLLTDRINSFKSEQSRIFLKQGQLKEAKFDALGILTQLEKEADGVRVDDSFRISHLLIQSKLYSSGSDIMLESPMDSVSVSSLELQNQYDLDFMTVSEFRGMLENWIATIDDQIAQLAMEEETYLEKINTLEVELRNLNYQKSLLDADYNTYRNTYETLQKKNEEIALTMSDLGSGYVKLASLAAVPDKRLQHNTIRNTLIGGVAGGILGLAGVVISDWWKTGEEIQDETREKNSNKI